MADFVKRFKANKLAYYSFLLLSFIFIFTLFAEFIANDKPIFVYKDSRFYFPIFYDYAEVDFGGEFLNYIDYSDPYFTDLTKDSIVIWPLIPYSYDTIIYDLPYPPPIAPNAIHLLGTDDQGRDLLARLIYGIRISLLFGFISSFFSILFGIFYGAISGYYGGKIDLLSQRFIEIWASMPILFLIIILSSFIAPTFFIILLFVILFSWMGLSLLVRAEFLRIRNFDYIKASKALGVSDFGIIFRHILPNAFVSVTTYFPFIIAGSIATLTSLDFLGFGLPVHYASLGEILNQGKENLAFPHIGITGFIALSVILSLLVFIGDGVRNSVDKSRSING